MPAINEYLTTCVLSYRPATRYLVQVHKATPSYTLLVIRLHIKFKSKFMRTTVLLLLWVLKGFKVLISHYIIGAYMNVIHTFYLLTFVIR